MSDRQFMFMINGSVDDEGSVTLGIEAEPYFHNDEDVWNQDTEEWERMRDQDEDTWGEYNRAARALSHAFDVFNAQPSEHRFFSDK